MTLKCVGTYLDGMDHELEQHVCKHFDIIKRIGKGVRDFIFNLILVGIWNCVEGKIQEA